MKNIIIVVLISLFYISATLMIEDKKIDSSSSTEFTEQYISELVNDCNAADSWIKLNINNLPVIYEDLVKFPDLYKRHIYVNSTNEIRYNFWKSHLERAIESNLFTEAQITKLKEIKNQLTPELLDANNSNNISSMLDENELKEVFGDKSVILTTLTIPNNELFNPNNSLSFAGSCNCNINTILACGFGSDCNSLGCQSLPSGCGLFGLSSCNGTCSSSLPGEG